MSADIKDMEFCTRCGGYRSYGEKCPHCEELKEGKKNG